MNDFIIPEKLKQNVQTGMSQNPTPIQRKMISKLAEELTEREYHELCHQLHGTKEEFDQEDGECSVPYNKYFYTVQSALYRGIFWQTLERLDFELNQVRKLRYMEEEWLEEPDDL